MLITEDVIEVEKYINKTWKQFDTKLEIRLDKLFPKPLNKGLNHIWKYGSADLCVYKNEKLICIIEVGGSHHMQNDKQKKNDARKWKLCDINNVSCLTMMNGLQKRLSNRKWRNLLGRYLFGIAKELNLKTV